MYKWLYRLGRLGYLEYYHRKLYNSLEKRVLSFIHKTSIPDNIQLIIEG